MASAILRNSVGRNEDTNARTFKFDENQTKNNSYRRPSVLRSGGMGSILHIVVAVDIEPLSFLLKRRSIIVRWWVRDGSPVSFDLKKGTSCANPYLKFPLVVVLCRFRIVDRFWNLVGVSDWFFYSFWMRWRSGRTLRRTFTFLSISQTCFSNRVHRLYQSHKIQICRQRSREWRIRLNLASFPTFVSLWVNLRELAQPSRGQTSLKKRKR